MRLDSNLPHSLIPMPGLTGYHRAVVHIVSVNGCVKLGAAIGSKPTPLLATPITSSAAACLTTKGWRILMSEEIGSSRCSRASVHYFDRQCGCTVCADAECVGLYVSAGQPSDTDQ